MTRIRYKKKVRREFWRTGKIREDAKGMAKLRSAAYQRSGGYCECRLAKQPRPYCGKRVSYIDGHLHHIISRARGGSDILDNVAFVTRQCHRELTGVLHWTPPACEEWAR